MIRSIYSSLPTFKKIEFHQGLNVLLADTEPESTNKQTRNSAGKTSLVEIIHFLYGSDCDIDSIFRTEALIPYSFTATLVIGATEFTVERSGATPAKIFIAGNGQDNSALELKTDKATGRLFLSNVNWRAFLGHALFKLPKEIVGTAFEEAYTPTFRAMFSYFARRANSGGFISPERHAEKQQKNDWQTNLSYLLGLDWQIPYEFHKVRSRERSLEELRKAVKGGAFGALVGTVAELRPQLTVAETKASKLKEQLANFEVLDSYKDLSKRAARSKADMQAFSRNSITYQETLEHLQDALTQEAPPQTKDLRRLYRAVGIELPGVALRRFEEVQIFHASVVSNRKAHLQEQIADTKREIAKTESQLSMLDLIRKEILQTLEGRGALEDFLSLQKDLAELEASAASLRERYKAAEILEGESTQLDIDRVNLKLRLQEDHQQRKAALDESILVIADAIQELYEDRAGQFLISASDNGPEFKISIEGDRGGGVSKMEIFCLDLALLNACGRRYPGPGFLVHDSHLFDGVDERQIAIALSLVQRTIGSKELQYIVTMNSDIFNRLPLSLDISASKVVLQTRLSDSTDTGGLFGFRFD